MGREEHSIKFDKRLDLLNKEETKLDLLINLLSKKRKNISQK